MKKDVTIVFEKALMSQTDWLVDTFYSVLSILKENEIPFSFWDGEENWVSILNNINVIGFIWHKYPLIILEKDNHYSLNSILECIDSLNYLYVESLSISLCYITDHNLKKLLNCNLNLESFTIEDLWFYTNAR